MPQSLLHRALMLKEKSLVEFCAVLAGGLTSLYLAWTGWGVWSLVWGSVAIMLAKAVGMNLLMPNLLQPSFSFRGIRKLVTFGGLVTGQRVLWSVYSQADILVVAKVFSEELVGMYTMAMHLASLPIQKLNTIINEVAFPAFARVQDDPEKVASHFLKGIRLISVFAFPICWGLSSVAPELVAIVLGTKWQSAAEPLQILALVMPLFMLSNVLHTAVNGLGHARVVAATLLLACILMPVAFVIGSRFGLVGVCFAWVIAYPVVFLVLLSLALPIVGVRWTEFFMAMALPALAGAFTYVAVIGAKHFATGDEGSLVRMLALILVGASAYCGLLMSAYRDGCREVLGLVRR
jgi:O-antigen/teichoic acid export membrane protein